MAYKGQKYKKYSARFKINVIVDKIENHLGYAETARKYGLCQTSMGGAIDLLHRWERRYLEEGAEGLMRDRRRKARTESQEEEKVQPDPTNLTMEELIAENRWLRMEIDVLKKFKALDHSGESELEKVRIISELRQKYPLNDLLKLLGMPRSTFYYRLAHAEDNKYVQEEKEIQEIFESNKGRYGYRRVSVVMRDRGYFINHKTVLNLMNKLALKGKQFKNSKYRSFKGVIGKVADNILNRDFHADGPLEKLVTDVTQFKVGDCKVYLSPVMDLYNREILSYSISLHPDLEQIRQMLSGLFEKLQPGATPLLHSDQGWQYQHAEYQRLLAEHSITQSMSRKGNCLDNSVMENFFGRLKVEAFYGEKFDTVDEFVCALKNYIEYYNHTRISLKLNGMSPVQYRTHACVS